MLLIMLTTFMLTLRLTLTVSTRYSWIPYVACSVIAISSCARLSDWINCRLLVIGSLNGCSAAMSSLRTLIKRHEEGEGAGAGL